MVRIEFDVFGRLVTYLEKGEIHQKLEAPTKSILVDEATKFLTLLDAPFQQWHSMAKQVVTDLYMEAGEDATHVGVSLYHEGELEKLAVLSDEYLNHAVNNPFSRQNPQRDPIAVWNADRFDEMTLSLSNALKRMLEGETTTYEATILFVNPRIEENDLEEGTLYFVKIPDPDEDSDLKN